MGSGTALIQNDTPIGLPGQERTGGQVGRHTQTGKHLK